MEKKGNRMWTPNVAQQKSIRELEKDLTEALEARGALGWRRLAGSWRGNRRMWGPFISIEFPGGKVMTSEDIRQIYFAVREAFGPCFLPIRECRRGARRIVRVELKEEKE